MKIFQILSFLIFISTGFSVFADTKVVVIPMGSGAEQCPEGQTECSFACYDLKSDELHCGGCGVVCPVGYRCNSGTCQLSCQSGLTNCGGMCVNVSADEAHCGGCSVVCPVGYRCNNSVCQLSCQSGMTNCNNKCVDILTDESHCGACGHFAEQDKVVTPVFVDN